MDLPKNISKRKQALIAAKKATPVTVGEMVYFREGDMGVYTSKPDRVTRYKVVAIDETTLTVIDGDGSASSTKRKVDVSKIVNRDTLEIGVYPFSDGDNIRYVAFSLESVLHTILGGSARHELVPELYRTKDGKEIQETNWNPFVIDANGQKVYYQRPFVWTLKDKQLLIESIYQRIDCGRVLVRQRSYEDIERMAAEGETELAFKDIVDGKQRINAISGFVNNEYPDLSGNYWGDLSFRAQSEFMNCQALAFAEMPTKTTDAEVIKQFLKSNFTGAPMSQEHIDFVRSIRV